ncbi:hypothetical protein F7734_10085 [Scytonema sp. UIC 10036]|uniref:hypothetical protein n=1 Tax=Scytonema sp. UIC 10036 TaxID=2304196 RepID=UPI0012DA0FB6|nr:hypothetical protein [Scytonema sp. UIC 10036]MUG92780.1 hypothetical protein [Scytonema sp. UIC 10036]
MLDWIFGSKQVSAINKDDALTPGTVTRVYRGDYLEARELAEENGGEISEVKPVPNKSHEFYIKVKRKK